GVRHHSLSGANSYHFLHHKRTATNAQAGILFLRNRDMGGSVDNAAGNDGSGAIFWRVTMPPNRCEGFCKRFLLFVALFGICTTVSVYGLGSPPVPEDKQKQPVQSPFFQDVTARSGIRFLYRNGQKAGQ